LTIDRLITVPKPRKICNVIEARKFLDRWERSGEPLAAWCRQRGLSHQSLAAYKRYRYPPELDAGEKKQDAVPAVQFVELHLDPTPPPPPKDARYVIRLQNGRAIELGPAFRDDDIQRLIALVETC
jgi:hypothetical protein